jgi:hypothetical protein
MSTQKLFLFLLLALPVAVLGSCGGGDPSDPPSRSELFTVGLVPAGNLDTAQQAVIGSVGTDSVDRGRVKAEVEVEMQQQGHQQGKVEAEIEGGVANATYAVSFCPFAGEGSGCSQVGSVATDGQGQGKANLNLVRSPVLAGIFLLSRSGQNQFVSGINIPRLPNDRGEALEMALQPASTVRGGLGSSFPSPGSDPLTAGSVEVGGGRNIDVAITGALANASYNVRLCPFGLGAAACTTAGSLATNGSGQAAAQLNFPQQASFAGLFVLTRTSGSTEVPQFVTGFSVP